MSSCKSKGKGQIIKGVILAMAISALLCSAYALLIEKGKCSADIADTVLSIIVLICSAIGSAVSNIGSGNRILRGLLTGVIFAAALVVIPILAYPDMVSWGKIARIIAFAVVGGLVGSLANLNKSNKKFRKSRKKRT